MRKKRIKKNQFKPAFGSNIIAIPKAAASAVPPKSRTLALYTPTPSRRINTSLAAVVISNVYIPQLKSTKFFVFWAFWAQDAFIKTDFLNIHFVKDYVLNFFYGIY